MRNVHQPRCAWRTRSHLRIGRRAEARCSRCPRRSPQGAHKARAGGHRRRHVAARPAARPSRPRRAAAAESAASAAACAAASASASAAAAAVAAWAARRPQPPDRRPTAAARSAPATRPHRRRAVGTPAARTASQTAGVRANVCTHALTYDKQRRVAHVVAQCAHTLAQRDTAQCRAEAREVARREREVAERPRPRACGTVHRESERRRRRAVIVVLEGDATGVELGLRRGGHLAHGVDDELRGRERGLARPVESARAKPRRALIRRHERRVGPAST
jgi:hypothetical protein